MKILFLLGIILSAFYELNAQWEVSYGPLSTESEFNGLCFINDSIGYTTVNQLTPSEDGMHQLNMIWKTVDYGVAWDTLYADELIWSASALPYQFVDVFFLDEMHGWACADGRDFIWKTTDGGLNWNVIDPTLSDQSGTGSVDPGSIVFYDAEYGVLQYVNAGSHGAESFDGGETWTLNDNLKGLDISMVDPCEIGTVFNSTLTNKSGCDFLTHEFPSVFPGLINLRIGTCIHYWDETNFICGGLKFESEEYSGSVVKTTDGGASWYILDIASTMITRDIEFYDEFAGYMSEEPDVPQGESILKTTDGGYTWYAQEIALADGISPVLLSLNCPSLLTAYGTDGKRIYRTLNGGGSPGTIYTTVNQEETHVVRTIAFPNPVTDIVRLQGIPSGTLFTISVFNTLGQQMLEVANQSQMDLSSFSSGIYFLQIEFQNSHEIMTIRIARN